MSELLAALSASIALLALVVQGCGGDEPSDGSGPDRMLPSTERPQIAFFTTHPEGSEGVYDIALSDDRGNDRDILTGGSRQGSVWPQLFTRVSWSPDGGRIAFGGGPGPLDATLEDRTDIYVVDVSGGIDQLTDVGDADDPVWSADGETIAFTRTSFPEGGALRGDLWSMSADGSAPTRIAAAEDWESFAAGSFSPDGAQLAVTRLRLDPETGETSTAIYVMGPDGSDAEVLIDEASAPAFSPDGESIAFVTDRDTNGELCYGDRCFPAAELYVANADGGDAERLTETTDLNEASPTWLPDGSRIAYQRGKVFQNAEAMSILELNADGSCGRQFLKGSGRGAWFASPAWRPSEQSDGDGRLSC